jgi:hypothetical protein
MKRRSEKHAQYEAYRAAHLDDPSPVEGHFIADARKRTPNSRQPEEVTRDEVEALEREGKRLEGKAKGQQPKRKN